MVVFVTLGSIRQYWGLAATYPRLTHLHRLSSYLSWGTFAQLSRVMWLPLSYFYSSETQICLFLDIASNDDFSLNREMIPRQEPMIPTSIQAWVFFLQHSGRMDAGEVKFTFWPSMWLGWGVHRYLHCSSYLMMTYLIYWLNQQTYTRQSVMCQAQC